MRRQKDELDAHNAQLRQQQAPRGYGRPGPAGRPGPGHAPPAPAPAAPIEMIADLGNLVAVWLAARKHLIATGCKYLETTLGHLGRLETLNPTTGEASIWIPANQRGFANEKARVKIEESLRDVTGKGIKLTFTFPDPAASSEADRAAEAARAGMPAAGGGTITQAHRVSPETQEAVENAPVVQELMKRLDARIVNIELLNTDE